MRKLLLFLLVSIALPALAQNGKKVYADFHGVRYTRQHDGKLGRWEMYANTEKSSTGRKSLCYNADLIDSEGRHEIAAVAYPQVGMQSNLDPDYIEYQILSAKAAKIDGFFIEWGFKPHENDILLREMQKVAAKYNFEIGVNWCDGWLYYDWITKIYPQINTREAKTGYMAKCYQYLVDSVFTGPTAPIVKGMPVFYHFGPGAKVDEYRKVLSEVKLPQGMPYVGGLIGENWRMINMFPSLVVMKWMHGNKSGKFQPHGFLHVSGQEIRNTPNGIIMLLRMMSSNL